MKSNQMGSRLKAIVFVLSATMFFAAGCRAQSAKKSDAPSQSKSRRGANEHPHVHALDEQ